MYKKQVRLFKWTYMINNNENWGWKWKKNYIDMT